MDSRRVGACCPHVSHLLRSFPSVGLSNLPTVDNVPTLLTGAYPHEHEVWGPKLPLTPRTGGSVARAVDFLPDLLTTTAQCALHVLAGPLELATMPPRRRRRFEIQRFKFVKYGPRNPVTLPIHGFPSLFTVAGSERCRFTFHTRLDTLDRLLPKLASDDLAIEMVEIHCLDELQHWRLDRESEIAGYYRAVDDFVAELHRQCRERGWAFLVLCDHGMEPVVGSMDLRGALESLGPGAEGLDFFIENTRATFWFHNEAVREAVRSLLGRFEHGAFVFREELTRYGIHVPDRGYGDAYFYARPGHVLFPNDFYQPVVNAAQALLDWQQRPRLRDPVHKGDHGYFPESECERGYMILADLAFTVRSESASVLDFAPSVLHLLGCRPAETMKGQPAFHHKSERAGASG